MDVEQVTTVTEEAPGQFTVETQETVKPVEDATQVSLSLTPFGQSCTPNPKPQYHWSVVHVLHI